VSQDKKNKPLKSIIKEIAPSKPNIPSKNLLTQLTSIKIPNSILSQNNSLSSQNSDPKMKDQFDVRQKSLLKSSFTQSLRKIDNEKEKETFISEGNKKDKSEINLDEVKESISKVDSRLSEESITSNSRRRNPDVTHLYDNTVANRLKGSKSNSNISLGDLFNQSVEEKVELSPKDPLEYISKVLGRNYNTYLPNLDRYKPIRSVQDILRERGRVYLWFGNY
jgi:hypothetical protein